MIMDNDLLNKGGSIIFDNALFYGEPYSEDCNQKTMPDGWGVKICNEFIVSDTRVHRVGLLLSLSRSHSLSLSYSLSLSSKKLLYKTQKKVETFFLDFANIIPLKPYCVPLYKYYIFSTNISHNI